MKLWLVFWIICRDVDSDGRLSSRSFLNIIMSEILLLASLAPALWSSSPLYTQKLWLSSWVSSVELASFGKNWWWAYICGILLLDGPMKLVLLCSKTSPLGLIGYFCMRYFCYEGLNEEGWSRDGDCFEELFVTEPLWSLMNVCMSRLILEKFEEGFVLLTVNESRMNELWVWSFISRPP